MWVHISLNHIYLMLATWTPFFLVRQMGTSMQTAAMLGVLPFVVMAATAVVSGVFADYLLHSGWEPLAVRRFFMGISLLGPAAALAFLTVCAQPSTAICCIMMAMGALSMSQAGYHAFVQDVSPNEAGRIIGLTNTGGTFFSLFGTGAVGIIYEATGSFNTIFLMTSVLCATGYVVFWIVSSGGALLKKTQPQTVGSNALLN